ncbi:MAG: exodeoxyribonuclease VII small subunit [Alphaproteobacteria bacterium]|nr:exodeoxyribonuclease VII small subunit [Alphaproteobacteria bacterium]
MKKDINKMEFEEALAELEKISVLLNEGKLSLKESVKLYEDGAKLKAHCSKILESVELKINQISLQSNGVIDIKDIRQDMEA